MNEEESTLRTAATFISGLAGRILIAAVIVLALYITVSYSFRFGHSVFYNDPVEAPPGTDIRIQIEKGDGLMEVADKLKQKGVIDNRIAFFVQGTLYKTRLYPGVYMVNTSMTTREMLEAVNLSDEEYRELLLKEETAAGSIEISNEIGGGDEDGQESGGQ